MLDPILAYVELIEGNNVLREVVSNVIICAKLTVDCFFRCQQVSDLDIQLFAAFVAYKINFLIARSAKGHFIAPAQQLQIHDILQDEIVVRNFLNPYFEAVIAKRARFLLPTPESIIDAMAELVDGDVEK